MEVDAALVRLREVAATGQNTMPALLEAVKTYATLGEMVDVLKAVHGEYREPVYV